MIKLHIIKEAYDASDIKIKHIDSSNIPCDGLTKTLPSVDYNHTFYKWLCSDGSKQQVDRPM